jgi:hypothetical protein
MGILDRLLGRPPAPTRATSFPRAPRGAPPADLDVVAVERYRYLLRTSPPDDLERAHAEAFDRLTPEQRAIVRRDLESVVPPSEAPRSDDAHDLARIATRAEVRTPGTLERAFGGSAVPGMGGSFLQTFAAVFVATTMAQMLFSTLGDPSTEDAGNPDAGSGAEGDLGDPDAGDARQAGGLGEGGQFDDFGGDLGDLGGFDI